MTVDDIALTISYDVGFPMEEIAIDLMDPSLKLGPQQVCPSGRRQFFEVDGGVCCPKYRGRDNSLEIG